MFSHNMVIQALLALLLVLPFGVDLRSEKPTGLRGTVIDKWEHAPIRNVYILVHRGGGTDKQARTDESGRYSIELSPNIYDVFVSADGFAPVCRKVMIEPDGMMVFDAVLEASNVGAQQ